MEANMKARWLVLSLAGAVVVLAWTAVVAGYFLHLNVATWTVLVTIGALSLEGFFWVAAGVLGWSFLAGRRAMLVRWRQRLFGRRGE
jgi:hypothetical protein